jgi:hypothetical protein
MMHAFMGIEREIESKADFLVKAKELGRLFYHCTHLYKAAGHAPQYKRGVLVFTDSKMIFIEPKRTYWYLGGARIILSMPLNRIKKIEKIGFINRRLAVCTESERMEFADLGARLDEARRAMMDHAKSATKNPVNCCPYCGVKYPHESVICVFCGAPNFIMRARVFLM